jgi:hypothetical protein
MALTLTFEIPWLTKVVGKGWVDMRDPELIEHLEKKTGTLFLVIDGQLYAVFATEAERLQWKLTWM